LIIVSNGYWFLGIDSIYSLPEFVDISPLIALPQAYPKIYRVVSFLGLNGFSFSVLNKEGENKFVPLLHSAWFS